MGKDGFGNLSDMSLKGLSRIKHDSHISEAQTLCGHTSVNITTKMCRQLVITSLIITGSVLAAFSTKIPIHFIFISFYIHVSLDHRSERVHPAVVGRHLRSIDILCYSLRLFYLEGAEYKPKEGQGQNLGAHQSCHWSAQRKNYSNEHIVS